MSQPENSNKPAETSAKPIQTIRPSDAKDGGRSVRTGATIALAVIAILALGFGGYAAFNPHVATVTEQQMITNTQSVYSTQTQTVTSFNQVTVATTQTITSSGLSSPPGYYQYCSPYGCMYPPGPSYNTYNPYCPPNPWYPGYYNGAYYGYWNGNFVPRCSSGGINGTVTCTGYIFEAQNGCTVLVIPVASPYYAESIAHQYYTLHNLPSNTPANGSWATVTGQLYQGSNVSSNGASCPGNHINVTSVS